MPAARLILLRVLALPVAEIAAFWLVADATGLIPVLVLLLAASAAGMLVLAGRGRRLLWRISRRAPHRPRPETAAFTASGFIVAGGILPAIPGFLTGVTGVLLLIPFSQRRVAGAWLSPPRGAR